MNASDIGTAGNGSDRDMAAAKQSAREAKARIDEAMEEASDGLSLSIGRVADQAQAATAKLVEQARGVYDRASTTARDVAATVDPVVQERPYLAVGLAAAGGLLLGLLIGGHGPRVVYVKPRA